MSIEFEITKNGATYRWRLQTDAHEIAAIGDGYDTKEEAMAGAMAVKEAVAAAPITDRTDED